METFRQMVNDCIRTSLKNDASTLHKLSKLAFANYHVLSDPSLSVRSFTLTANNTVSICYSKEVEQTDQPVNIKQVTVCRGRDGKWYAVTACDILRKHYSKIVYSNPVGIDVAITNFAHDSDNHVVENPQFLTMMLKPVKRAHRRVSRRLVGSSNHRKAKDMLARLYEKINNRRKDFLHKVSTYYSSRYDLIFLEQLKVLNMTKNHKLARKILDGSWCTFKHMLKYKANRVMEVEPAYSSINCSRCDNPAPKSLAVRTHVCPKCRAVLDRDYNSAMNHLQNGLKVLDLAYRWSAGKSCL